MKRIGDIPTTYYIRPVGSTAWNNLVNANVITSDVINEVNELILDPSFTYYVAAGNYTTSGITISSGKIYGGFSGNETSIDLNARPLSDKDGNGIIEPWEFTNEAIITTSNPTFNFTGGGTSTRLITISGTGAELNGVTISDFSILTNAGPISVGFAATTPSASNNVSGKEGILRLCTVKKIKSAIGIVMSTNKYSIIDRCLIESNVVTGANSGGAVYLNYFGGKVTGCVIRNNASSNTNGRAAGVWATSFSSAHMDAIVENSVIYNNYGGANGGAIRGDAQANKRGIEIINTTIVNNQTATSAGTGVGSVELINGGVIVNSIIVGDPSSELRANTTNNYVINTAYGEYATGASALYGANNVSGKVAADFNFTNPTLFAGVMIPDFTTPWDQAKYDAIRQANFKITSSASVAATAVSTKSYPANYLIGGTGASVVLSTYSIPTTDLLGVERPISTSGHLDLGAYQFSGLTTAIDNKTIDSKINNILPVRGGISISNAKGELANVYNFSGHLVKSEMLNSDNIVIKINNGLYIVKVGLKIQKVFIK